MALAVPGARQLVHALRLRSVDGSGAPRFPVRALCRGDFEHTSFDFLGYTFRGRTVLAKGKRLSIGFNPAMSTSATKAVGKKIRDWHLNRRSGTDLSDLAREINPQV